jgi:pimeloyl-ACP methyl ester carboxylesterase
MTQALVLSLFLLAAPAELQSSHRKVVTEDGASLALHRFLPPGKTSALPPVLLVADVGFGRPLFDFKGAGLARWLASRGRVVYVAELRGQGASDQAHSLRTIVHLDLPVIGKAIAAEHPGPIDLVVQGFMGTLAMAASTKELQVRRVVALSTPVSAEEPTELARAFLSTGGRFTTLASSPEGFGMFEQLFALGAEIDPSVMRGLAGSTRDLSSGVSAELLAWMETGDLPLDDGTSVVSRLRKSDRPTLLLVGLADGFTPSESCVPLRGLTKGKVRIQMFSRMVEGDDFAHASLLLGTRAAAHVYPAIERHLAEVR